MLTLAPLIGSLSVAFSDAAAEETLIKDRPGDENKTAREGQLLLLRAGIEVASIITAYVDKTEAGLSAGRIADGAFYANTALLAKSARFWIVDVAVKKTYAVRA